MRSTCASASCACGAVTHSRTSLHHTNLCSSRHAAPNSCRTRSSTRHMHVSHAQLYSTAALHAPARTIGHKSRRAMKTEALLGSSAGEQQPQLSSVQTMDGKMFKLGITPGSTTAGNIRRAVAEKIGAEAAEVRLAYAGRELDPATDDQAFVMKPQIQLIQAMQRMKGGGLGRRSSSSTGTRSTSSSSLLGPDAGSGCTTGGGSTGGDGSAAAQRAASRSSRRRPKVGSSSPQPLSATSSVNSSVPSSAAAAKPGPAAAVVSSPETAPGSGMGFSAEVSLAKQFRDLMKHPIPGISAAPDDDDPLKWHIRLAGPDNSPYAGGWFNVELQFSHRFPGSMPSARFITPIWHPNISSDGNRVCVNLGGDVRSVVCVLSGLKLLLAHPNPSSPVNYTCGREMRESPAAYASKARAMTVQHAMK